MCRLAVSRTIEIALLVMVGKWERASRENGNGFFYNFVSCAATGGPKPRQTTPMMTTVVGGGTRKKNCAPRTPFLFL